MYKDIILTCWRNERHIFFNDKWYGFDDGHYSGAELIVSKENI